MLSPAASNNFPGLDLVSSPDESGCVDCLNVDLDIGGAVRVRDGYDNLTASAAAGRYTHLAAVEGSTWSQRAIVAARGGTTLELLGSGGTTSGDTHSQAYDRVTFASTGSGGTPFVVVGVGTDGGHDYAGLVSLWSSNSRLVAAGLDELYGVETTLPEFAALTCPTAAAARVHFSDPGTVTFTADNDVDLDPNDGELLKAIASWRDQVFVWKESKFFAFYGESTDAGGDPIFHYRTVHGAGCLNEKAVAVAPEGVYFCARDGVYLTTGGPPVRISDPVEPIFSSRTQGTFGSSALNHAQEDLVAMTYLDGRVYLAYPSGSGTANDRTLVYDTKTKQWVLWGLPAAALSTFRDPDAADTRERLIFAYASGSNHVGRMGAANTDDDGTAIVSRYRTGFQDFGTEDEKSLKETRLFGTGTPTVKYSRDFDTSLTTGSAVTLGTSPAIAEGLVEGDVEDGRLFSVQIGAASGAWAVHRMAHYINGRPPATETP